jgi:hypothetical protein
VHQCCVTDEIYSEINSIKKGIFTWPALYADDAIIVNSCKKNECIEDYIRKRYDDNNSLPKVARTRVECKQIQLHGVRHTRQWHSKPDWNRRFECSVSSEWNKIPRIIKNYLKKKISSASGILYRLRKVMPIRYKKLIYHTLIGSRLNYMNIILHRFEALNILKWQKKSLAKWKS